MKKIGTLKESSLHRALKFQYSGDGGSIEEVSGPFVCDACREDGELIEVQTGSFGPLKEKAKSLCEKRKLRIIHPIIVQKTIELYDASGRRLIHRRKSPKKGSPWDLFNVLIYAPELPLLKNLTIELALINAVEKRLDDGAGSWRRKGVSIADRFLGPCPASLKVPSKYNPIVLKTLKDYRQFLPFRKNESFTARSLAEKAGISAVIARKAIYVLAKMGLAQHTGKQGRAFVYTRSF